MRRAVEASALVLLVLLPACGNYDSLRCALGVTLPTCPPTPPPVPCAGFSWIVKPVQCEGMARASCAGMADLDVDPNASPPQARLRVGQATLLELSPINPTPPDGACLFNPGGVFPWISSDPAVARIERTNVNTSVIVRAESRGDAEIFADGVSTPAGPIRASLAYCTDSRQGASCTPINLVLRVVR
jgi:hypothetical protein